MNCLRQCAVFSFWQRSCDLFQYVSDRKWWRRGTLTRHMARRVEASTAGPPSRGADSATSAYPIIILIVSINITTSLRISIQNIGTIITISVAVGYYKCHGEMIMYRILNLHCQDK